MAKTTLLLLLFIWLLMNISPSRGKLVTTQVCFKQSTPIATDTGNNAASATDTTTTMTTTKVGTDGTGMANRQYYGEALHEVPSGANPESNK